MNLNANPNQKKLAANGSKSTAIRRDSIRCLYFGILLRDREL